MQKLNFITYLIEDCECNINHKNISNEHYIFYTKKYNIIKYLLSKGLDKEEKKYCSCLMKVRSKKINNPYGICTNAVYSSRNSIRNRLVNCAKHYDFKKYNLKTLKLYAKEKKIKGYSKLNRKQLLQKLQLYQNKKNN